jgi:hypothetical protein
LLGLLPILGLDELMDVCNVNGAGWHSFAFLPCAPDRPGSPPPVRLNLISSSVLDVDGRRMNVLQPMASGSSIFQAHELRCCRVARLDAIRRA